MSPLKEKFLTVPSLYQILVIIATVLTVAFGLEARISSSMEKNFVSKVDYVTQHAQLQQQLMVMQQKLNDIADGVKSIRNSK